MTFNPILHASSKQYYWKGTGALSIKTFRNGRSLYNTGHGHYAVEENSYLILNRGQEYSITIESDTTVESFCIFFPDGMIEDVRRSFVISNKQLLDEPFVDKLESIEFVEKTYFNDHILAPSLFLMRQNYINHKDGLDLEECLHDIIQKLLLVQRLHIDMLRLPPIRLSTREELYKRIQIGQDYMIAYYNHDISLTDIAQAACLSPNHFLRNYKLVFGCSPRQYVTERRLLEAKRLLTQTDKSVTEICLDVGYRSISSFSTLFRKRFGLAPSNFRNR